MQVCRIVTRSSELVQIYNRVYDAANTYLWDNYDDVFTPAQIARAISTLDDKKDSGPMGLSVKFFKYNIERISYVLANHFNAIFAAGVLPQSWTHAFLTPIPKKGNLMDITNYRGIAMQSVIPKLFDKVLTDRIYTSVKQAIPPNQHGFVKQRSTITNLFEISQFLHESIQHNERVDVIYFDFSKAFDVINYRILAAKLSRLAFPYQLFIATMNFIATRHFSMKVDGTSYDVAFDSHSGVPQDMLDCINNTANDMLKYADDTKMFHIVNGLHDMYEL